MRTLTGTVGSNPTLSEFPGISHPQPIGEGTSRQKCGHMYQPHPMPLGRLLLRRCEQIAELATSHDEGDMLDLSGYLRQVLLDKHDLASAVKPKELKLSFHVGQFSQLVDQHTEIYSLEDGIDPKTCRTGAPSVHLNLTDYIKHVVSYVQQSPMTIKDLISYAANTAGGVHHDPSPNKECHRLLRLAAQRYQIGGLPLSIGSLQAIARVTLRGLDPLIAYVKSRQA